jgi:uncharacterized protein YjdB
VAAQVTSRRRRDVTMVAVWTAIAIGSLVAALWYPTYVTVCYIGAAVGVGEIVSRYRDAPDRALSTTPALLYILVNAAASIAALYFANAFDTPKYANVHQQTIVRVLLAGFGAMAFFRTSLFIARIGDQDIAIGPVAFLQVILNATDRAVDRERADARAQTVQECMSGVSFDAAQTALPAFCLALMQNLSADEQKALGQAIKDLQGAQMDAETKAKNLGLVLLNVVGDKVLRSAVNDLGPQIKAARSVVISPSPVSLKVGELVDLDAACYDSIGRPIEGKQPEWSSDDTSVATVAADGRVRGMAAGRTTIRATSDGVADSAPVTVASA